MFAARFHSPRSKQRLGRDSRPVDGKGPRRTPPATGSGTVNRFRPVGRAPRDRGLCEFAHFMRRAADFGNLQCNAGLHGTGTFRRLAPERIQTHRPKVRQPKPTVVDQFKSNSTASCGKRPERSVAIKPC
ncbi:Hypothetical protein CINCED_3A008113 [Cinara cedri]|uniref:Uncharacterized protein n=1 Tax=Cinara cedri TaxID=506608 RepID=A0A5E4MEV8_9HEMI|nr:Hypothetical protein CINCED_3A008113 [Cinara cedri]